MRVGPLFLFSFYSCSPSLYTHVPLGYIPLSNHPSSLSQPSLPPRSCSCLFANYPFSSVLTESPRTNPFSLLVRNTCLVGGERVGVEDELGYLVARCCVRREPRCGPGSPFFQSASGCFTFLCHCGVHTPTAPRSP
ncbi:hypothetical protein B0H14DRAFT_1416276 [Mycena olivaceomarginata]|nr:hypothetical protein B0H14DRAFT_1416276 [Mycena olivaceomarginata]